MKIRGSHGKFPASHFRCPGFAPYERHPPDARTNSIVFRPTPGMDRATAVAANASGIYVVGSGLRKYDADGNELWTRPLNGPAGAIAADPAGVYILGMALGRVALSCSCASTAAAAANCGPAPCSRNLVPAPPSLRIPVASTPPGEAASGTLSESTTATAASCGLANGTLRARVFPLLVTDSTGVYVLSFGSVGSSAGVLVRKWDSRGNELWRREYATGFPSAFTAAQPSGFFIAGGPGFGFVGTSLRRYDAAGNELLEPSAHDSPSHRLGRRRDGTLHRWRHQPGRTCFAGAMQVRFRRRCFCAQIRSQRR